MNDHARQPPTDLDRREFLLGTGAAAAAMLLPITGAAADDRREPVTHMSAVREAAMTMPRVDTHSHYGIPVADLKVHAQGLGSFVNNPGMIHSRQLAAGCRKLYGIDPGIFLRPDSPEAIFEKAAALREQGPGPALEAAMDADNITTQLCFCGHHGQHAPLRELSDRVRLLAYIDNAICGNDHYFTPDGIEGDFNYLDALCAHFGELGSLDDYLDAMDTAIDAWRGHRVVGMKTAAAYTIGLSFTDPSRADAEAAFSKKRDMSPAEVTSVQHFAFRHALLGCLRNELPVVVHTGFQIWGHSDLRQSNPMHLHNLLVDERYKDITWVLLHGGNPYTGETTYLARMFPNVNIDFTWISWMTRARFRMALAEWLEIVPHGKLCWGSDSGLPENIVGIGQLTREIIANVLEDQIDRRIMDERVALEFLEHCYEKTPTRLFQL